MRLPLFAGLLAAGFSLSACAPLILGGAATMGYMAVQERGLKTAVVDTGIKTHIKEKLTNLNYYYLTEVGVNVQDGDVLLTGIVQSPDAARQIEEKVREVEGVRSIYNELFTQGGYTPEQYTEDTWIGSRVRAQLLAAKDIYSVNHMVSAVNGHVYIMGLAETQSEMERIVHIARTTKGVKQVHNYIKLSPKKD